MSFLVGPVSHFCWSLASGVFNLFHTTSSDPMLEVESEVPYFWVCETNDGQRHLFAVDKILAQRACTPFLKNFLRDLNNSCAYFLSENFGALCRGIVFRMPIDRAEPDVSGQDGSYDVLPECIEQALWSGNVDFIKSWVEQQNAYSFVGKGVLGSKGYIPGFSGWNLLELSILYDLPDLMEWLLQKGKENEIPELNPNNSRKSIKESRWHDPRLRDLTPFSLTLCLRRKDLFEKMNSIFPINADYADEGGHTYLHNVLGFFGGTFPDAPGIIRIGQEVYQFLRQDCADAFINPCLPSLLNKDNLDVNAQTNETKGTALHFAVLNENPGVVEILLRHSKIDLDIQDAEGLTPKGLCAKLLGEIPGKLREIEALNDTEEEKKFSRSRLQERRRVLQRIEELLLRKQRE